ncbi:hypothetical protein [Streptobacillus moniliformis]|uniref:hypothetical protein n=1 Tax=Streptobacillus moniliformis TaxID=34105 RepID=UPI0007E45938|nr:hypothetical protein [Streptobacillus moniliformis]QXW65069.1 hypothetical protein KX935_04270 [Streptobacillus moniliformis]
MIKKIRKIRKLIKYESKLYNSGLISILLVANIFFGFLSYSIEENSNTEDSYNILENKSLDELNSGNKDKDYIAGEGARNGKIGKTR